MLPDEISMEPFQQYLAETFPKNSKCSTSSVVHELDSTVNACWKTLTVIPNLAFLQCCPSPFTTSGTAWLPLGLPVGTECHAWVSSQWTRAWGQGFIVQYLFHHVTVKNYLDLAHVHASWLWWYNSAMCYIMRYTLRTVMTCSQESTQESTLFIQHKTT